MFCYGPYQSPPSHGLCGHTCGHLSVGINAVNLLRGATMFLIFVCKRSCWEKVREVVRRRRGGGEVGEVLLLQERGRRRIHKQSTLTTDFGGGGEGREEGGGT